MAGLGRVATGVDAMIPFTPGFSLPVGLGVYHGTPHRWAPEPEFPQGRFRLDKIGTGEGAQAYGHGAYFAENPGVAKGYRDTLTGRGHPYANTDVDMAAGLLEKHNGNGLLAAKEARSISRKSGIRPEYKVAYEKLADELANGYDPRGAIYELDLPVEDVPLLDWDAPLSEQPAKVREALNNIEIDARLPDNPTGGDIMRAMGSGPATSETLNNFGIRGLRYKDAMSRSSEGGTRNYVIWDQGLLDKAKHK
jgi:hypothetical protein